MNASGIYWVVERHSAKFGWQPISAEGEIVATGDGPALLLLRGEDAAALRRRFIKEGRYDADELRTASRNPERPDGRSGEMTYTGHLKADEPAPTDAATRAHRERQKALAALEDELESARTAHGTADITADQLVAHRDRLDAHRDRLDTHRGRLNRQDERLDELNHHTKSHHRDIDRLKDRLDTAADLNDKLSARLATLERAVDTIVRQLTRPADAEGKDDEIDRGAESDRKPHTGDYGVSPSGYEAD